jgi:hypothetical protein
MSKLIFSLIPLFLFSCSDVRYAKIKEGIKPLEYTSNFDKINTLFEKRNQCLVEFKKEDKNLLEAVKRDYIDFTSCEDEFSKNLYTEIKSLKNKTETNKEAIERFNEILQ